MTPLAFAGLDELEASIGRTHAQSEWITITQDLVDGFAALTNDRQWIHVDAQRAAAESPYGTTIAHGFLTLSLLSSMMHSCITHPPARLTLNYGFDRVRFISAVPVGGTICARFVPAMLKRLDDGAEIGWDAEVIVRGSDRPALAARWLSRLVGVR